MLPVCPAASPGPAHAHHRRPPPCSCRRAAPGACRGAVRPVAESLTGPSPVLSKGAVPQAGNPPAAGDSLGTVNASGPRGSWPSATASPGPDLVVRRQHPVRPAARHRIPVQLDGQFESAFRPRTSPSRTKGCPANGRSRRFRAASRSGWRPSGLRPSCCSKVQRPQQRSEHVGDGRAPAADGRDRASYNTTVFIGTMFQTCVSTSPQGQVRQNAVTRITGFNSASAPWPPAARTSTSWILRRSARTTAARRRYRHSRRRRAPPESERVFAHRDHVRECRAQRLHRARVVPVTRQR
jgi:hypothetical protein